MSKFLGKESKYGTPYLAILLMAGVDAILVRWGFATLIVIDVFLLMLAHITIYISAVRLRIKQPGLPRPFKVKLGSKAFAAMCVVPVAVAVLAMSPFGNGWNYFVWGSVAARAPAPPRRRPRPRVAPRAADSWLAKATPAGSDSGPPQRT